MQFATKQFYRKCP